MESIQSSAVDEETPSETKGPSGARTSEYREKPPPSFMPKKKRKKTEPTSEFGDEVPHEKYTKEFNSGGAGSLRAKRAARPKEKDRNTCSLFIQTDPLIWKHISEQVGPVEYLSFLSYYSEALSPEDDITCKS